MKYTPLISSFQSEPQKGAAALKYSLTPSRRLCDAIQAATPPAELQRYLGDFAPAASVHWKLQNPGFGVRGGGDGSSGHVGKATVAVSAHKPRHPQRVVASRLSPAKRSTVHGNRALTREKMPMMSQESSWCSCSERKLSQFQCPVTSSRSDGRKRRPCPSSLPRPPASSRTWPSSCCTMMAFRSNP